MGGVGRGRGRERTHTRSHVGILYGGTKVDQQCEPYSIDYQLTLNALLFSPLLASPRLSSPLYLKGTRPQLPQAGLRLGV